MDGTFEGTSDALKLLSGPQFTRELLRAFGCLRTCHFNIGLDLNKLWDQTFTRGVVHETSTVERKTEDARPGQTPDPNGRSTSRKE